MERADIIVPPAQPVAVARTETRLAALKRLTYALLLTGLASITLGILFGPLQAFNYFGINVYPNLRPGVDSYYQGLTLHGVLNAFSFTTFFMSGLMYYLTSRELEVMPNLAVGWLGYIAMLVGLILSVVSIFSNSSTVLYTFYPPMQASWAFYLGLALIFVGSWVYIFQILHMVSIWRAAHPGRITPLAAWMSVITEGMWFIASIGVAWEIVVYLLPWSLGLRAGVDPLLMRTLFWWTGHPIVYFWLLPAYISWYTLVPRQAGGVLVSEPLARVAFVLLLLFSLPVGTHHQLEDAGIPTIIRGVVIVLTYMVIIPSLMTAFTVGASLEYAGRKRGGSGLLGWIWKLPWNKPSFSAQAFAMLIFIIGGASGLVNASWILNVSIHNTIWVPGHFHATLASASALTFFGIMYWLIPHLTGKPLFAPRLASTGNWLWLAGMTLFSLGMMTAGLLGVPRRAWVSGMLPGEYLRAYGSSLPILAIVGIGGLLLLISIVCIMISLWGTAIRPVIERIEVEIPFAVALHSKGSERIVKITENYWLWFGVGALLMVVVYGPLLAHLFGMEVPLPGIRRW